MSLNTAQSPTVLLLNSVSFSWPTTTTTTGNGNGNSITSSFVKNSNTTTTGPSSSSSGSGSSGNNNTTVLSDINLSVLEGEIFGLLGASGCGKTTLVRLILGRLQPCTGIISLMGNRVAGRHQPPHWSMIGYMPQDIVLYQQFTPVEMLSYFGQLYQMPDERISARIEFILRLLHLEQHSVKQIGHLSGGQKRRISLAIALLHEPKFLILDEPTVGVDPLLREAIWKHLKLLTTSSQPPVTVFLTTHYIEEARDASSIGFLRNGQLLVQDSPQNLLQRFGTTSMEYVFLALCRRDTTTTVMIDGNGNGGNDNDGEDEDDDDNDDGDEDGNEKKNKQQNLNAHKSMIKSQTANFLQSTQQQRRSIWSLASLDTIDLPPPPPATPYPNNGNGKGSGNSGNGGGGGGALEAMVLTIVKPTSHHQIMTNTATTSTSSALTLPPVDTIGNVSMTASNTGITTSTTTLPYYRSLINYRQVIKQPLNTTTNTNNDHHHRYYRQHHHGQGSHQADSSPASSLSKNVEQSKVVIPSVITTTTTQDDDTGGGGGNSKLSLSLSSSDKIFTIENNSPIKSTAALHRNNDNNSQVKIEIPTKTNSEKMNNKSSTFDCWSTMEQYFNDHLSSIPSSISSLISTNIIEPVTDCFHHFRHHRSHNITPTTMEQKRQQQHYLCLPHLWTLMQKNFRQLLRNYSLLGFFILLPTIEIALIMICIGRDISHIPMAVYNGEAHPQHGGYYGADLSEIFLESLPPGSFALQHYNNTVDAIDAVHQGKASAFLSFSPHFSTALRNRFLNTLTFEPPAPSSSRNSSNNLTTKDSLKDSTSTSATFNADDSSSGSSSNEQLWNDSSVHIRLDMSNQLIGLQIQKDLLRAFLTFAQRIATSMGLSSNTFKPPIMFDTPIYGYANSAVVETFIAPGALIMIAFFATTIVSCHLLISEIRHGLIERAIIAGATSAEFLFSHIIIQSGILLVQLGLVIFTAFKLFQMPYLGSLPLAIVLIILQGLCGLMYGLTLSATCPDEIYATTLAIGTFFPSVIIGGIFWPLQSMPLALQYLSHCLPSTQSIDALRSILLRGWTLTNSNVAAAFAVSTIWLVGFLFCALHYFQRRI